MEEKKKKAFDFTKLKKENFVVIFLIGMLLLIIAWPSESKKEKEEEDKSGITDMISGTIDMKSTGAAFPAPAKEALSGNDMHSYTDFLEQTLEEILMTMEGAGKVKVMITLKSSGETIVEKDGDTLRTTSTEVDSAGGSRNAADISETEKTIYTENGSGTETPFVREVIYPRIEGVVVCAEGGGSATVNKNITDAIQVLFGIDVHKIKVIKMSSK